MGQTPEHHGHGHGKMHIPDYKIWKIEGTPLEKVQARLAEKGLEGSMVKE
ncbi:unnamed protein product [Staurois parvus]|uniref:Uncharacterized protein n=1 Tax=Staurois parvus TaxID=386267 RepID=A0ABN9HMI8_9NEOB|nr:unnamed protein product [Staurois parvus]